MAWDDDGTVAGGVVTDFTSPIDEWSSSQKTEANDEDDNIARDYGNNSPSKYVLVVYPELREVDGIFYVYGEASPPSTVDTSGDTTNGIDGSWTQRIADLPNFNIVAVNYRSGITSMAVSNVRGLRVQISNSGLTSAQQVKALHLYGTIAAGETPDRLLWVDNATGSEFGLPIDYGDIPRGSAEDRQVKLRNNSGTLTASSVQVTAEAPYLGSGAWYTFSEGGAFQSTLPLASAIGAGADSPVITLRRIVPDAETLGLHAARAYASVGSWS